jgi:hypothetical protein
MTAVASIFVKRKKYYSQRMRAAAPRSFACSPITLPFALWMEEIGQALAEKQPVESGVIRTGQILHDHVRLKGGRDFPAHLVPAR